jgi:preprotein translocase subunit SecE
MFGKTANFFRETKQELNKVTWPSRNELLQATAVVILASFILGAFITCVDFLISNLVRILLG